MSFQDERKPNHNQETEPPAETGATAAAQEAAVGGEAAPGNMELLVRLQMEKDELAAKYNAAVRHLADLDNARKRIERERREDAARAIVHVIEPMLPVLDGFERALAAHSDPAYEDYRKGFELIYRQLLDALGRFGVERIEALGRPFDPHVHQAVERVESNEHEDGTVVEDLRHGYKLRERVLRPALVRVAFRPAPEPADAEPRVN
ncbi:MAG: nucleotide exchange factor GrpE [Acidobacteria bacterium]|nr:nucleotide exchange factor GrpE [Acidobacteriota bacterium]MBI3663177.1 nucleotide exchange factor GrpE [Acidobacteriota bacterium]